MRSVLLSVLTFLFVCTVHSHENGQEAVQTNGGDNVDVGSHFGGEIVRTDVHGSRLSLDVCEFGFNELKNISGCLNDHTVADGCLSGILSAHCDVHALDLDLQLSVCVMVELAKKGCNHAHVFTQIGVWLAALGLELLLLLFLLSCLFKCL